MIDQHNSLAEKFLKKGIWLYLFSFIIAPIWYIIKIIISGELSVSEVGILYGVISLIWLVAAFNDMWFTESLNYFIPKFITEKRYDKVKSILTYALITQMTTWIIIALFFFFWAEYISSNYFKSVEAIWVMKVFSIFFLWINVFQIVSTFFIAIQNTFYNKVIELIRMSFTLFAVLIIFFYDFSDLIFFSYSWIVWLYIWIIIAVIIFFNKYYKKYLSNENIIWEKELFFNVFKYAITIYIWVQAWVILSQIDMQMIIYLLWTTDAWYYTNYLSIIWIPFTILLPIFWLLLPIFSELNSKWENEKIKLIKSVFQNNLLSVWIAFNIIFFIFAEIIAYILFWEKFIKSWIILQYSILFLIFNFLLQVNFNILTWIWKVKERVKIIFVAIIFNFILNIILINYIWVYWAALATWIWWFLIWVLSEYYLGKNFKVDFKLKYITKNILLLWIIWVALYNFILPLFEWIWRLNSFLLLLVITIIYFWIFVLINYIQFKFLINEVKKIRKKTN
jgi:O-antigen/teichoic acid export membrane protein